MVVDAGLVSDTAHTATCLAIPLPWGVSSINNPIKTTKYKMLPSQW